MKKVLVRFYNRNNLGDDLFIKILSERYLDQFVVSLVDSNKTIDGLTNVKVLRNKFSFIYFRIKERFSSSTELLMSRLAKECDLLIHIGGSLFIENHNVGLWQKESRFYNNLNLPYYIIGSNIGPYQTKEFLSIISTIFLKAEDVCLRDSASYELVSELTTTRSSTDIAFSLDVSNYEVKSDKTVIFSIINSRDRFDAKTALKYDIEILNMTNIFIAKGYKVVFMSFCKNEGDEEAIIRLYGKLNQISKSRVTKYFYEGDLETALNLIAGCEVIVASRFHASILGILFGKRVLPLAYSAKTTNILKDIGFKGPVIDINNINEFDANKLDIKSLKVNNADKQISLAQLQFEKLDKVLSRN
jgi:colanic acid/amylovoran biosynthesis protein